MDIWASLYVFVLASFIGLGVIRRVSRLLHTPLMSITNAMSAIAVVGSIIVTGSDYPVLQDWEVYRETFAYIERLGLPKEVTDEILHHNAQKLFGFDY